MTKHTDGRSSTSTKSGDGDSESVTGEAALVCNSCGARDQFVRERAEDGKMAMVVTLRCTECGDSATIHLPIPKAENYELIQDIKLEGVAK